jgi:hypothetical protein
MNLKSTSTPVEAGPADNTPVGLVQLSSSPAVGEGATTPRAAKPESYIGTVAPHDSAEVARFSALQLAMTGIEVTDLEKQARLEALQRQLAAELEQAIEQHEVDELKIIEMKMGLSNVQFLLNWWRWRNV